ncbi:DoxX family protein [Chitinophagaceae bacterium MMS25-I14]
MVKENEKAVARVLLGAGLIFAGISHLSYARRAFRAQVPDWVPLKKDDTVVYSGIAEIALGSALVFADKNRRKTIGQVAAAFFIAVFPGNISQFVHKRSAFGLNTDRKRFIRLLFQPALVYWALKSTGKSRE